MIAHWPALRCRRRMVLLQVSPLSAFGSQMLAQTHLKLANFPAQRAAWRALRCRGSAERDVSLCAATTKVFCRAAAQRCTTPGPTMGMALKHDGQRLEESPRVAGDGWAR